MNTPRGNRYDIAVLRTSHFCQICNSPNVTFAAFAAGDHAPITVARLCKVCYNAEEL